MKILLALAVTVVSATAAPRPFFVFDNGVQGKDLTTFEAKLDLVKATGFDGISWRTDTPAHIEQLIAAAKQRQLKIFAIYVQLDLTKDKMVYDPQVNQVIEAFKGSDTLIWPWMTSKAFANSDPAGDPVAVAGLRELADRCAASGLKLAIYPHVGTWLHRHEDALRLIKQAERKNLGISFNLCHALMDGAEDRIEVMLDQLASHLMVVTLNGADSHPQQNTWKQLIQPLGQGSYHPGIVLKKLDDLGYRGPVGLQCYNLQADPRVHLVQSMAAWRKLNER